MQKEQLFSIGAVVLAFLASQHHALHILLLAAGLGGASATLMTTVPLVRRVMLVMALAMVVVIVPIENLIRHELASEVPNRVIIPPHAGDGRTAVTVAGVAREVATSARS